MIPLHDIALSFCLEKSVRLGICAMGPHTMPLGELSQFGFFRRNEDFSDVIITDTKAEGWMRVKGSAAWILLSLKKNQLKLLFANTTQEEPFAFVFFVKAEEARILGKKYAGGGLQRFSGVTSQVEFVSGREKFSLTASDKGQVQVIPLGGGEHFWGADFLVAFEGCEQIEQKVFAFEKIVSYDEAYALS